MDELGMVGGFDVGLEMSGKPAGLHAQCSTRCITEGGSPFSASSQRHGHRLGHRSSSRACTIKGIYGREIFETWYKMEAMIRSHLDISPVITHRFAFDDFQKGFDAMLSGESGKVVLSF